MIEYIKVLRHSFRFNGRLIRRSFWCFLIIYVFITLFFVYGVFVLVIGSFKQCRNELSAALIFSSCRRIYDSGYSLRWLLMGLVPVLGTLLPLKERGPYHN
ncbi:DUF805 domain-containing protein [Vibrio atlanticus]|nr:DUF805 domain-containing protein [Vibrio atlanticus]